MSEQTPTLIPRTISDLIDCGAEESMLVYEQSNVHQVCAFLTARCEALEKDAKRRADVDAGLAYQTLRAWEEKCEALAKENEELKGRIANALL
jgi:hypothetical protein